MKTIVPDWKDAPDWAQYLAMDSNGEWCWFADKPMAENTGFWTTFGKYENVKIEDVEYWKDTLRSR